VAGAYGDALLDDARAFVHQRVQQPIENLLIGDLTALNAKIARHPLDERQHLRVRDARASLVAVEALTRLLTQPSLAHQALHDRRPALIGREPAALADSQAHVVAGQVPYRQRPHRETETLDYAIDPFRRSPSFEQELGRRAFVHQTAIAVEAVAVASKPRVHATGYA